MSNSQSVMPKTIDWESAERKRDNDVRLYKAVHRILGKKQSMSMLTFPADKWIFEQGIIKWMPECYFTFHGVERDPIVHRRTRRNMYSLRKDYPLHSFHIRSKPESLIEYGKGNPDSFDIVYADWMGTWSKEKEEELHTLFKCNVFNKVSAFLCTIMLGRGQPQVLNELRSLAEESTTYFPFIPSRHNSNYVAKTKGFERKIMNIATQHRRSASLNYLGEYRGMKTMELSFVFEVK